MATTEPTFRYIQKTLDRREELKKERRESGFFDKKN